MPKRKPKVSRGRKQPKRRARVARDEPMTVGLLGTIIALTAMPMVARRKLIWRLLEGLVSRAEPENQTEIAELICDIGIDLVGAINGLDTSNAMILIPEDPIAQLIQGITQYADQRQIPHEDICEGLLATLAQPHAAPLLN